MEQIPGAILSPMISPLPTSQNSDNITRRRKEIINISTHNSFESLNMKDDDYVSLNSSTNVLNRSCPVIGRNHQMRIEELEHMVAKLELDLNSADLEIQNLICENYKLKDQLARKEKNVNQLKSFCISSSKKKNISGRRKHLNKQHQLSTSEYTPHAANSQVQHATLHGNNETTVKSSSKQNTSERKRTKRKKVTDTSSPKNIDDLNKKLKSSSTPNKVTMQNDIHNINLSVIRQETDIKINRKLCIISSNRTNKVRQIAEKNFPESQVIHYLSPNAGIEKLTENIDQKLKDFTHRDYCVILIGERDFSTTNDYVNLIVNIRNTLIYQNHTNIVLCLPTYKCKETSAVFNWRVETFNNLLYLDILNHKYAYLMDSNLKLTYDYDMFTKFSGILNNRGLDNMFKNINLLVNELIVYNESLGINNIDIMETSNVIDNSNSDFFRSH